MHASPPRTASSRRFAWLLWFGLLLPVAQLAAASHALSHTGDLIGNPVDGKQAAHASHCDLCLSAAAIAGGAPLGTAPLFVQPRLRHAAPEQPFAELAPAPLALAYLSRAPPPASS
jgi:hypothetical protein